MKKVRTLLFMLMTMISLTGCKVIDSSSEAHSETQSASQSESETASTNPKGEKVEINASVILDYGTLKANKVTPILDQQVDFDVSKEIANAVYGDEVVISYLENEEEYDVEIIEKELIENITVFLAVEPGRQDGEFQCFTSESGVVLNISRIEYIINLDGSYIAKAEWSKFYDTPEFYASYNPEESKQTTEFTTLHYLTALYSYNPRNVE